LFLAQVIATSLAITHVTVVDGTGSPPRHDVTVVVRDRRIAAIGPADRVLVPRGATVVEGRGKFLIPGLWDLHTHLTKTRGSALGLYVTHGVTGVRDMGGDHVELRQWRREIEAGERVGPRMRMAGPYFESGRRESMRPAGGEVEPRHRTRIGVMSVADAHRLVDSVAAIGVDMIKVRSWDSPSIYHALGQAAARHGLPFVGHSNGLSIEDLLRSGQRSIEHPPNPLPGGTALERRERYARLAAAGVAVVPTLVVWHRDLLIADSTATWAVSDSLGLYDPERRYASAYLLADWREQLEERSPGMVEQLRDVYPRVRTMWREMLEAGVRVLPGTDTAVLLVYPGTSLHDELELFVSELGMSPMEAIVSATGAATKFLGISDSLGTIERGQLADMVLLDADPLVDIRSTRNIRAVFQNGRYFGRDELDRLRLDVLRAPDLRENDWSGR
jgi:hypothetical protein